MGQTNSTDKEENSTNTAVTSQTMGQTNSTDKKENSTAVTSQKMGSPSSEEEKDSLGKIAWLKEKIPWLSYKENKHNVDSIAKLLKMLFVRHGNELKVMRVIVDTINAHNKVNGLTKPQDVHQNPFEFEQTRIWGSGGINLIPNLLSIHSDQLACAEESFKKIKIWLGTSIEQLPIKQLPPSWKNLCEQLKVSIYSAQNKTNDDLAELVRTKQCILQCEENDKLLRKRTDELEQHIAELNMKEHELDETQRNKTDELYKEALANANNLFVSHRENHQLITNAIDKQRKTIDSLTAENVKVNEDTEKPGRKNLNQLEYNTFIDEQMMRAENILKKIETMYDYITKVSNRHADIDALRKASAIVSGPQQHSGDVSGPQQHCDEVSGPQQHGDEVSRPQQHSDEVSGPQQHGDEVSGPQQHGDEVSGPQQHSNEVSGPQQHGDEVSGPQQHGDKVSGPQQQDNEVSGPQQNGDEVSGPQQHGDEVSGPQQHNDKVSGPQQHSDEVSGPQQHGDGGSGSQQHGDEVLGSPQQHGDEVSGPKQHGDEVSGPQQHGDVGSGSQQHSDKVSGPQQHGDEVSGPQQHGDEVSGPQQHGDGGSKAQSPNVDRLYEMLRELFESHHEGLRMLSNIINAQKEKITLLKSQNVKQNQVDDKQTKTSENVDSQNDFTLILTKADDSFEKIKDLFLKTLRRTMSETHDLSFDKLNSNDKNGDENLYQKDAVDGDIYVQLLHDVLKRVPKKVRGGYRYYLALNAQLQYHLRRVISQHKDAKKKLNKMEDDLKNEKEVKQEKRTKVIQLYYARDDDVMKKVVRWMGNLMNAKLKESKIDATVVLCNTSVELNPHSPVLLLYINTSRLGTDTVAAIKKLHLKDRRNVALVAFHHTDVSFNPIVKGAAVGPQFDGIAGIHHMAFLVEKGVYECKENTDAINDIVSFIGHLSEQ